MEIMFFSYDVIRLLGFSQCWHNASTPFRY